MTPRYQVEIPITDARTFVKLYFDGVRIPWGSRCVWVAGVRFVSDQPGLYLISGVGGLQGVWVIPPATEAVGEVAS